MFDEKINLHRILKPIVMKLAHGGFEAVPFYADELADVLNTRPWAS